MRHAEPHRFRHLFNAVKQRGSCASGSAAQTLKHGVDAEPCFRAGLRELALFAGMGGGILGGKLLGWKTVCAVEAEAGRAAVLCQRQDEGFLEAFPIHADVRTFDGRPWRGLVDVVSGGSPCQGFSTAGKGAGLEDSRSKLLFEMLRIIAEVRPSYVLLENSPVIRRKGLALVIGRLAEIGYACRWDTLSAGGVGACHLRRRLFLVAYLDEGKRPWQRLPAGQGAEGKRKTHTSRDVENGAAAHLDTVAGQAGSVQIRAEQAHTAPGHVHTHIGQKRRKKAAAEPETKGQGKTNSEHAFAHVVQKGSQASQRARRSQQEEAEHGQLRQTAAERAWPAFDPGFLRVVHGFPSRVVRIEALGDSQVPRVVRAAWNWLTE